MQRGAFWRDLHRLARRGGLRGSVQVGLVLQKIRNVENCRERQPRFPKRKKLPRAATSPPKRKKPRRA